MTERVTSADGTSIAFTRSGTGAPLVLIDGAGGHRGFGPLVKLPALLANERQVVHYDRRGRGESGDTGPYSPAREVEDLSAVINAVGGRADVFGISSGGGLALLAAIAGLPINRLICYEPPYLNTEGTGHRAPADALDQLRRLIAADQRGRAVRYFLVDTVGSPAFVPWMMRLIPGGPWKSLEAVAPTLAYDVELMNGFEVPVAALESVSTPTVAVAGGKSPDNMIAGVRKVAASIPGAKFEIMPGQTHMINAKALAPHISAILDERSL